MPITGIKRKAIRKLEPVYNNNKFSELLSD